MVDTVLAAAEVQRAVAERYGPSEIGKVECCKSGQEHAKVLWCGYQTQELAMEGMLIEVDITVAIDA